MVYSMGIAVTSSHIAWRILRSIPPLTAWSLLHHTPAKLVEIMARMGGREEVLIPTVFLGYKLEIPLGIAAGFDKDPSLTWLVWSLGFGFHVVGSVLARPNPGIEPKMLVRLPSGATINRLGLPSQGPTPVARKLSRRPPRLHIAISIAGFSIRDYLITYKILEPYADWFEINISCPNVEEHRSFEEPEIAAKLCKRLRRIARKPLLLKIPPTTSRDTLWAYVDVVNECGIEGIVAANTLRVNIDGMNAGLGGPPLYPITLYMVRSLRELLPSHRVIVASGGVDRVEKALQLLSEGANLVELLSLLVQKGPYTVSKIMHQMAGALRKHSGHWRG